MNYNRKNDQTIEEVKGIVSNLDKQFGIHLEGHKAEAEKIDELTKLIKGNGKKGLCDRIVELENKWAVVVAVGAALLLLLDVGLKIFIH